MAPLLFPLLLVLSLASVAVAQFGVTYTIEVGRNGSFYIPDSVNPRIGDTVQFKFFDAAHGVVQTSFDAPCQPLEGGFSSGVVMPANGAVVEWDLQITNLSTIWFFCPVRTPVLHCSTGMVGAINPQGESQVDQFKSAAKAFTGSPPAVVTALNGVGATASATPTTISSASPSFTVPPANSTSIVGAPFNPSTKVDSTAPPTTIPEDTSSSNHTAAIVGGAVAGIVALFATIIVVVIILRRRPPRRSGEQPQQTHPTVETHYFPTAASPRPPSSGAGDSFVGKINQPPTSQTTFQPLRPEDVIPSVGYVYRADSDPASTTANSRNQVPYHVRNQSSQGNFIGGPRPIPSSEVLHQHPYAAAGVDAVDSDIYEPEQRPENISALAKEVAAVLLRGQSQSDTGSQRKDGRTVGSESPRRNPATTGSNFTDAPPPDYKSRGHSTHHDR